MSYVKLKVADIPYRNTTITIDDFTRNKIFVTAEDGYQMEINRPKRIEWINIQKGMKKEIEIRRTKKSEAVDKIENYYAYLHVVRGDNEIVAHGTKFSKSNWEKELEDFTKIKVDKNIKVLDIPIGMHRIKIVAIYNTRMIINLDGKLLKMNRKSIWNEDLKAKDIVEIDVSHVMGNNHAMYGKIEVISIS